MKRLVSSAILVFSSLVAALAARFLWIRVQVSTPSADRYQDFVLAAGRDLMNSILPGLLLGGVILWLMARGDASASGRPRRRRRLAGLSTFYVGMAALAAVVPDSTFPALTWLLAWPAGLTAFLLYDLSRRLDPRTTRSVVYSRPAQLLIDGALVGGAFWLAYLIRYDGAIPPAPLRQLLGLVAYVALFQIGVNYLMGVYAFIWRLTGLREALVIAQAVLATALVALSLRILFFEYASLRVPFGVLLVHPMLAYAGMMSARVARRVQHHRQRTGFRGDAGVEVKRLLLVGAGRAGRMLVRELERVPTLKVVGFLDDDPRKLKRIIQGVKVLGPTDGLRGAVDKHRVSEVTLCLPTAPKNVLRKIVAACEEMGVPVTSIPSLSEIILRKVSVSRLRPVRMEDLLGRASIEYAKDDLELIGNYAGRRIMITGAAGSIGSELVRQLKEFGPACLILLDKDENGLHEVSLEVGEDFDDLAPVIADVRDRDRLRRVFEATRPELVFHAAAFKHVPMMELHPCEAILNNVRGSRNLVDLAAENGVRNFVLISTDKAVNPTNVMGASKRIAEMIVQKKAMEESPTRFCCVRFGNVLGSRASVVPLFQKQIRQGRNITVTHPDVQRYFMTIPEAVQLVIQAGSLGRHGEIFVLDMGDPVKIVDLARGLIELSGLTLDRDISIEFTGLRPGEKMFEELLISSENGVRNTSYPKVFEAAPLRQGWPGLELRLTELENAARAEDTESLYALLEEMDIGYVRPKGRTTAPTAG